MAAGPDERAPGGEPLVGREARQVDHDRTLAAMHELEAALAAAAPGREASWHEAVVRTLAELEQAVVHEDDHARRPDSLLSDIQRSQPRLRNRVRAVRLQYQRIRDDVAALGKDLREPADAPVDFADIRQRVAWLLTALRHERARESDLIYEAYYDAFRRDVEADA